MYLYYVMIIAAAVLTTLQYFFSMKYQKHCGISWTASLSFSIFTSAVIAVYILAVNRFHLEWSWFSFRIAFIAGVLSIVYTYSSIRALSRVNLAVYSMFAMLGGMLLPTLFGIVYRKETFTWINLLCVLLIVTALVLSVAGERNVKRGWGYYVLVFVLEGNTGVLAILHQSNPEQCVDSQSYVVWVFLSALVTGIFLKLSSKKKVVIPDRKAILYVVAYAVVSSTGLLFSVIAIAHLPASAQYPLLAGGTMLVAFLISVLRKEKFRVQNVVGIVLALISTFLIIL